MRRLLPLIIIMLFGMCSVLPAKANPTKQLQKNLAIWEQFRWQGIVQVQSSAFSIRKNFVLAKNKEAIRLDILDSGVMGLTAQPLVSIYLKDSIVIDAPSIKQLQGIDPNWFISSEDVNGLINITDSLLAHQDEIISTLKTINGTTSFIYDKQYRLVQIKSTDIRLEANITYDRHNNPSKIAFKFRGNPIAELQIIEREDKNVQIEPLVIAPEAPESDDMLPEDTTPTE
jgi:hypothetical protein